jgi:hypothetical protein
VYYTLQLRLVPGSPTVVRGPPRRFTGMLKEVPRPPTEIELSPPLETLKRSGPRRAEWRRRKPMAISGSDQRDGPSRVQGFRLPGRAASKSSSAALGAHISRFGAPRKPVLIGSCSSHGR